MKKYFTLLMLALSTTALFSQTVIGKTSYDVQTNNGAKHRIRVYDDGKISGLWTGSTNYAYIPPGSPADRGMFYNNYNGVTWGALPTVRNETSLTGFGEILTVGTHEVSICHDGAALAIQLYANTAIGGTVWTELAGSDDITGFWPMGYCPEGTDDIYMINANANPPSELRFSRSDDGGLTWAVANTTVPFLTGAEGIPGLSVGLVAAAETYQIGVYGTNVYILFGMVNSDLVLLHSASNGDPGTWTNTVIHDFPLNSYDGLAQTDVDGDFVTDIIETTDGYHNMFIDASGNVHVFSGYVKIYNDGIGSFWSYDYNNAMGIWYWKTGMPTAQKIDLTLDWDNTDGLNDEDAGIGLFRSHYRYPGLTSMPGAAIDNATGNIYLTYTMPIEYTDLFGDPLNLSAQSYRDVFGVFSADGGTSWSTPVNFTNTAATQQENVYTSVYPEVVDGKVHMVWQRDMYPGTAITDLDPVDTNYILYNGIDLADFGEITPPACDYVTGPSGLYVDGITATGATLHWDEVVGAAQYVLSFWNTAFPETIGKKRPTTNSYFIAEGKLNPGTTYGFRVKTVCYDDGIISPFSESVYFTTLLRQGDIPSSILIYPNPSDGNFRISLTGFENSLAEIFIVNAMGQVVYQSNDEITSDQHVAEIYMDGLASGLYKVIIKSGDDISASSIVVE
ncbi:MAG: T9SS type A sorting domain-containing protein [Chitinophagales bacterium]